MLANKAVKKNNFVKEENSVVKSIVLILGGIVCSCATIAGIPSVLNISLVAISNATGGIFILLGSLMSYFYTGQVSFSYPQMSTMLTIIVFKFSMGKFLSDRSSPSQCAFISGGFYLFYAVGFAFFSEITFFTVVSILLQAAISSSVTYFAQTLRMGTKTENARFAGILLPSLGILYTFFIASLTSIDFWNFNLGRIIGVFFILVMIKRYRMIGGAITGILSTVGITICSLNLGLTAIFLPCAAIISALFPKFKTTGVVLAFMFSNFMGLLLLGVSGDTFNMLFDISFATILYILLPQAFLNGISQKINKFTSGENALKNNGGLNILLLSKVLTYINSSFSDVSKAILANEEQKNYQTFISEAVCKNCNNSTFCWVEKFEETEKAFSRVERELSEKGYFTDDYFVEKIPYCRKKDEVKSNAFSLMNQLKREKISKKKLTEMREFLEEQFKTTEELLTNISHQFSEYAYCDDELSIKVSRLFFDFGFTFANASVKKNNYGYYQVEVFLKEEKELDDIFLQKQISSILECDLSYPQYFKSGNILRISLFELSEYEVDIGAYQICGKDSDAIGDTYEIFSDSQGNSVILVSDGMGTGKRASLDSLLATNMLSKMIKAGVETPTAIKFINSSMIVREWEESFATVDISSINIYSATLEIIKAGGCATYIYRNNSLKKIEFPSFPIGILSKITPEKQSVKLKSNDIIITATDGLPEVFENQLSGILSKVKNLSSEFIAKKLSEEIQKKMSQEKYDDITIAVSKFIFAN